MTFTLQPLPYPQDALEPHIGARTVSLHHGKHHAGYVSKLNEALKGSDLADRSLEAVIESRPGRAIYNNAAQVWNHDLYWQSLCPEQTAPGAPLAQMIEDAFGTPRVLEERLKRAALDEFGSGWAWLAFDREADSLAIRSTTDAVCLLGTRLTPLLAIDVWEHAYYLDYQHDRARYLEAVIGKLLNWETATAQLEDALANA